MGFLSHDINIAPFLSSERRPDEAIEKGLMAPQSTKKKKKVVFWRGNDPAEAETSTVIFCFKHPRKVDYNQMLNTIETYTRRIGATARNKERRA